MKENIRSKIMAGDNVGFSLSTLQTHPKESPSGLQPDTAVATLHIKDVAAARANGQQSSEYFTKLKINKSIYS